MFFTIWLTLMEQSSTLLNQKFRRYLLTPISNVTSARETHGCLFQKTKQFFGRSSITW